MATGRRPLIGTVGFLLALLGSHPAAPGQLEVPRETHLRDVRQLTSGGENAEAYWSPDGEELVYQASGGDAAECDQIYRLRLAEDGRPQRVSTGQGRTTYAYFTADGERILYSSTHAADPECPPPPDRSRGYVWPIYSSYEIYSARPDGSDPRRLTDNDAYDAEATVCPVDGSIVFTSTLDGDLELYRMEADGSNVRRLTDAPGYDGGAFFSRDCSQIVWRASRPQPGEELEDYRELLARDLVRPGELEIWVADADGENARQVTYLGAASFAPYFFPSGDRILFSSNYGDPQGREFELWAVDTDGTDLERITWAPGFDGFPMFSPDGEWLAFASNRNQGAPGETDVYVARWVDGEGEREARAADRYLADVAWLADDARQGRGVGGDGLASAADWLESRFRDLGLEPTGEDQYGQPFEVTVALAQGTGSGLAVDGGALPADAFRFAAFSGEGDVEAPVVLAGYGVTAPELGVDDYADLEVRDKVVLVRRFLPQDGPFGDDGARRRYSDLRYKAFNARQHGAAALLIADLPEGDDEAPAEAPFPALEPGGAGSFGGGGDAGLPVAFVGREAAQRLTGANATLRAGLVQRTEPVRNVVGRLRGTASGDADRLVVLGAHYDHLGLGGPGSFEPDAEAVHNGADDNASGVAALLEAARRLAARRDELAGTVLFVAFAGEERGNLGSSHFVRHPPDGLAFDRTVAMINMDMVGRLRDNRLQVLGTESAEEWEELVRPLCDAQALQCQLSGDGYGPSDQTPFYAAGIPVLHLFTGTHDDYHRPSDDAATINAAGGAQIAGLTADLAVAVLGRESSLTLRQAPAPPPAGDARSYGASLGTVPDYAGPGEGKQGVLLSGVRAGGPAEQAGMQRGDLLVELAGHPIGDVYDLMYVLREAKPGTQTTAVVERDTQRLDLEVIFGEARQIR